MARAPKYLYVLELYLCNKWSYDDANHFTSLKAACNEGAILSRTNSRCPWRVLRYGKQGVLYIAYTWLPKDVSHAALSWTAPPKPTDRRRGYHGHRERGHCMCCGRNVSTYTPKGGDGSDLHAVVHSSAHGVTCQGSRRPVTGS